MAMKLITAPADLPVSVAEAKLHCRIDHADDDAFIEAAIGAAVSLLDGWRGILGRALMPQTWDLIFDRFPGGPIEIPLPPVASVENVNYVDPDTETETVLASTAFAVDLVSPNAWVVPGDAGWPATMDTINAVRVRFIAGYADAAAVPARIRLAIKLLVAHWYANRETVNIGNISSELPLTVAALIAPERVIRF